MAIRDIVKDGDEILRKKCRPVTEFNEKLWKLLSDMRETMRYADGVGLAAPQVGILRRVAVVEVDDVYIELINPVLIAHSGSQTDVEGCLSVKGKNCYVKRPRQITIEFYNRNGEKCVESYEDLPARACLHEMDHLDGVLFYDRECKDKELN